MSDLEAETLLEMYRGKMREKEFIIHGMGTHIALLKDAVAVLGGLNKLQEICPDVANKLKGFK